jgi:hypothetical protein
MSLYVPLYAPVSARLDVPQYEWCRTFAPERFALWRRDLHLGLMLKE